jgi:hypothetical protein
VKPETLERAVILINNRPRKSLGYKTPFEVFYSDKSDADALHSRIGDTYSLSVFPLPTHNGEVM